MKHPTRSTAALGAFAALCIAAPAAFAARPADAPEHPPHPMQANEHSSDAYGVQQHTSAPAGDTSPATDTSTDDSPQSQSQPQSQPPAPAPNPCGNPAARQVFAPWHDGMAYVLIANGGFEQADPAWTLANRAAVVEGNEPSFLNDAADHQSLSLP